MRHVYHLAINVPEIFVDNYMDNAQEVGELLRKVLTDKEKLYTLTNNAALLSFDTQLEITPASIVAVLDFTSEHKVKLQKGMLKKLLAEWWPWPKLNFTLCAVDARSVESPAESPTLLA